jgi:hypothetical protein
MAGTRPPAFAAKLFDAPDADAAMQILAQQSTAIARRAGDRRRQARAYGEGPALRWDDDAAFELGWDGQPGTHHAVFERSSSYFTVRLAARYPPSRSSPTAGNDRR